MPSHRWRSQPRRQRLPARRRQPGLTIEKVIETHFHADFLSGHLELAAATGALICYREGAVADFPIETLRDGEV
jgi:hydroxyacylglutathione hydrolase